MKISQESANAFNVVVLGAWNPAIFSPEWARQNLSENSSNDPILALAISPMVPARLTVDDVNIYVSNNSLSFDSNEYNEDAFSKVSIKIQRISELLAHTPVSAVGVNFRFVGSIADSEILMAMFTLKDAPKIDSSKFTLTETVLRRTFKLSDSTVLNLSIALVSGEVFIEFNFHRDLTSTSELSNCISQERLNALKKEAEKFLEEVYGVDLETA